MGVLSGKHRNVVGAPTSARANDLWGCDRFRDFDPIPPQKRYISPILTRPNICFSPEWHYLPTLFQFWLLYRYSSHFTASCIPIPSFFIEKRRLGVWDQVLRSSQGLSGFFLCEWLSSLLLVWVINFFFASSSLFSSGQDVFKHSWWKFCCCTP